MTDDDISAQDPYPRTRHKVLDTEMACVDTGTGDPVVFLHGNPTSSYLWRNIIPPRRVRRPLHRTRSDRHGGLPTRSREVCTVLSIIAAISTHCLTNSVSPATSCSWVTIGVGTRPPLGTTFSHPRQRSRIYFEAIVQPLPAGGPPNTQGEKVPTQQRFQEMRSEKGEQMILQENYFVEDRLPSRILRDLSDDEMDIYRKPYLEPGEDRRPTLTWPRELPLGGEPADVHNIVASYAQWLRTTEVPKLLIVGEPGGLLRGEPLEFCRTFPNQTEISVPGIHFLQEDSPHQIGQAIHDFITDL